jgi:osmotically inducible protein OsmC
VQAAVYLRGLIDQRKRAHEEDRIGVMLGQNNLTPDYIRTKAEITLEKVGEGFAITASHLTVNAKIPGADAATFERIANEAKAGCPVSKVLNAKISMQATLDA